MIKKTLCVAVFVLLAPRLFVDCCAMGADHKSAEKLSEIQGALGCLSTRASDIESLHQGNPPIEDCKSKYLNGVNLPAEYLLYIANLRNKELEKKIIENDERQKEKILSLQLQLQLQKQIRKNEQEEYERSIKWCSGRLQSFVSLWKAVDELDSSNQCSFRDIKEDCKITVGETMGKTLKMQFEKIMNQIFIECQSAKNYKPQTCNGAFESSVEIALDIYKEIESAELNNEKSLHLRKNGIFFEENSQKQLLSYLKQICDQL